MVPHHYSRLLNKESRPESSLPPNDAVSPSQPSPTLHLSYQKLPQSSDTGKAAALPLLSYLKCRLLATFGEDEVRWGLDAMTCLHELLGGEYQVLFLCSRSLVQHLAPLFNGGTDVFFAPESQE